MKRRPRVQLIDANQNLLIPSVCCQEKVSALPVRRFANDGDVRRSGSQVSSTAFFSTAGGRFFETDDGRAKATGAGRSIRDVHHARYRTQQPPYHCALHALSPSVNDPHVDDAPLTTLVEILLYDARHVAG